MNTKDTVQTAAKEAFKASGYWGLVAAATGVGKSKIGVDEASDIYVPGSLCVTVLVVPTQKLRDENWRDEFVKWNKENVYDYSVQRMCYASVHKIEGKVIDLLILDEGHNLTELSATVFKNNTVKRCLVLTATPPDGAGNDTDKAKIELFEKLKLKTVFNYSLDQAVKDGLVAPYEIRVVECKLDNTNKYIQGGTKAKPFLQTEFSRFTYLQNIIKRLHMSGKPDVAKWKILERMRFIKGLKSKQEIARRLMARWIQPGDRYIIFCGSIEQADSLGGKMVYHSKVKDAALTAFQNKEIDQLAVVEALNEGVNIPEVNGAVIVQLSSSKRDLVQRLGRTIRARPGHKAIIWILVTLDTPDEDWFKNAIEPLDKKCIHYLHYKNVI